jgi:hypothetical protein
MALFEVSVPDGTIYKIRAPDSATDMEIYTYLGTQLQKTPYTLVSEREHSDPNSSEDVMGVGQFFIEMIVGAVVLTGIVVISKVHNLVWIPAVGCLAGYAISQDASYAFSNVFGGLTFSLLFAFIAGVWIQHQKKKNK